MNTGKTLGVSLFAGVGILAYYWYRKTQNEMKIVTVDWVEQSNMKTLPVVYSGGTTFPHTIGTANYANPSLDAVNGKASVATKSPVKKNSTKPQTAKSFGIMKTKEIYDIAKKISPANAVMLATMARIESSNNPLAYRYEAHIDDASYGLVQTLYKTALWLQEDLGYKKYNIDAPTDLYQPEISLYFGNAYITWLKGYYAKRGGSTEEKIVRGYNGGQGWASSAKGQQMTLIHWNKYKAAKQKVLKEIGG